jgi:hypothetical protein
LRITAVHDLRTGLERQRLHGEMRQRAVADGGEVVFAGIGLDQRHQFANCFHAKIVVDRQRARLRDELGDRRDILARVVGQAREQQRVDGKRAADGNADGRAIGLGLGYHVGAGVAAGARLVLDHEGAAGVFLLHLVGDHAGDDVGRRAGAERDHDAHGLRRPALRGRGRCGGQKQ